jgi:hypothetical protein
MRRRKWSLPDEPLPAHPYRNSAIFHGVLAAIIVLVAWATGGGLRNAVVIAIAFFCIATGWSWTQWRRRLLAEERKQAASTRRPRTSGGRR